MDLNIISHITNLDHYVNHKGSGGKEVIFLEGLDGAASIAFSERIHDCIQEDVDSMTLLIPDRDRDNQDDFVWCLPVDREKWQKWYNLAEKFKGITPEAHHSMRYANRVDGKEVRTVLALPTSLMSDDDVLHACAFLRMVKNITCRIYVLRCSDDLARDQPLHKIIGVDPNQLECVDQGDVEGDEPPGPEVETT